MYCYEAHKCTEYDCPVYTLQVKRCWQYLEEKNGRPVTAEDCPYGPCNQCNYKLGWEIGLIGESMFPDSPDPTPESVLPDKSFEDEQEDIKSQEQEHQKQKELEKAQKALEDQIEHKEVKPDSLAISDLSKNSETINKTGKEDELVALVEPEQKDGNVGQKGLRFCYEIIDCPNENCIVRRRQIIQCFQYFARKTPEKKAEMTCSGRKCENCFVKRGWDIGVITEDHFQDILEQKKLKIKTNDRIKRNSLVEVYLAELSKKPLSRGEEVELAKKIAGDKNAAELFLLANLKLVMRVAKKFPGSSLGLMDLIQEGNIGLIKAISKFDYTLGYRFSTYAAYWIRYYMQKAVSNQGSTIRVPHHLLTVAHKIRKRIREYEYLFYKSPTLTELSKLMELSEEKILDIIRITQAPISLQAKTLGEDDEDTLEYYLSDKNQLTPEEQAIDNLKNETIKEAVANLSERLRFIVENYYGFKDEELSFAEMGRQLGISRERVRQLLRQALQKLSDSELIINLS